MKSTTGNAGWLILDPDTGEHCMWFRTRKEAREAAGDWGVVVGVVLSDAR